MTETDGIFAKLTTSLSAGRMISVKDHLCSGVLLCLFECNGELHLLFEKRADQIRQGREICFPGGRYDDRKDSSLLDTAARETSEELGISPDIIEVYGELGTLITPLKVMIRAYVAKLNITGTEELTPQPSEVERVFTVPLSFFLANEPFEHSVRLEVSSQYEDEQGRKVELLPVKELDIPERYSGKWASYDHTIKFYDTDNGLIWGITASIVEEFVSLWRSAQSKT
ncbi:MAG: CoA pyrophosphatase [Planctomycetota bacterium]|nr:CoA pyrophosphatase [Planctomycetota bacterium]